MGQWHKDALTVDLTKDEFYRIEAWMLEGCSIDRKFCSDFRNGEAQVREYFTSTHDGNLCFYRMSRVTDRAPDERVSSHFNILSPDSVITLAAYCTLQYALEKVLAAKQQAPVNS